jgi:hypothetical protein
VPQRKTFLSETSRELIERSYRVRARLRETLEEARRSDRKRDRARPSQRARESGEDRGAGVEPNPIHPTDAEQGSGSSGAEPIAKR